MIYIAVLVGGFFNKSKLQNIPYLKSASQNWKDVLIYIYDEGKFLRWRILHASYFFK